MKNEEKMHSALDGEEKTKEQSQSSQVLALRAFELHSCPRFCRRV
jgi:hypothetical protein